MSNSKKFLDYGGLQKYDELMKEYVSEHGVTGGQSDWTESDSSDPAYIKNKPTLGTASTKDVPTTGNASTSQVVMGNDSRLSDSRPASDVSSWAKASTKPTYTASEVGLGNVGNFKAVSTEANQGLSTTEQSNARANIGAGTSNFSGAYNDLTDKPTIPTVTDTYSATGTAATSGKAVAAALGTLDGSVSGTAGASKTLTAFSQTDGKVSATFGNISITKSQVSDLGTIGTAAAKGYTDSVTSDSTDLVTSGAVYTAIDNLPEPMVFKGSLGTGGTITALPVDGSASIGDTYKVITAGTYASQVAKVGDTFICLTKTSSANTWELIPSGDEPSGTVTSVKITATTPIAVSSSSAITTSGTRTISHNDSGVTAGTYKSVTVDAKGHVTDGSNPTTLSGYGITDAKIASGVITLGSNTITPLTEHQDISGKADKSATVSNVAYDTTNKKFTKTINGTTTDVAKLSTTSIGSASAGTAIAADDITAWTTNTPTAVTPNTVVTGGTTTDVPNISKKTVVTGVTKKTVVTSASGATASVSGCTLTITDGSFSTGDSCTVTTGDSVTVGTAIKAYTSLTTGAACTVTDGTAASLSYTAKSIPNISVSNKTVATGFTTT